MRRRTMPLFVTAMALLAGCVSSDENGARSPAMETRRVLRGGSGRVATDPGAATVQTSSEAQLARGEELFEAVCTQCHSMQPPPTQAPPMAMVVGHYREALDSDAEVSDRMIRWIAEPAVERSALPAHAVDRFGIMPPHPLPEEDRAAIVHHLLSTVPAGGTAMGGCPGTGAGMRGHGMMRGGRGMRPGAGGTGMGAAGAATGCTGGCMAGGDTVSASAGRAPGGG